MRTLVCTHFILFCLYLLPPACLGGGGRGEGGGLAPTRRSPGFSLYTAAVCKCRGAQRPLLCEGQLLGLRPVYSGVLRNEATQLGVGEGYRNFICSRSPFCSP